MNTIISIPALPHVAFMQVQTDKYTIIDANIVERVSKYKWYLHAATGYVTHSYNKSSGDIPVANNQTHMYLHQFIMQTIMNIEPKEGYSVDHINWKKIDNRCANLRHVTQSVQNMNRETRNCANRTYPPEELNILGVYDYPKHVRYDKSQMRFIIEKHPQLVKEGKKQISGTRKGSITNRYHDIMIKGIALDEEFSIEQSDISHLFMESFNTFTGIVKLFHVHMESSFFDETLPRIQPTFQGHLQIISNQINVRTEYTNIKHDESNTGIVYNGNVVCEDESMTLTRDMIPKYVNFTKETAKIGCRFTYGRRVDGKNVSKQISASSKSVTLKVKFDEMIENFSKIVV